MSFKGKRARVIEIGGVGYVHLKTDDDDWLAVTPDDIDPIPLSHELFEELKFEEMWWGEEWSWVKPLQGKGFAVIQRTVSEWVVAFYPHAERCLAQLCDVKQLHIAEGLFSFHNTIMIED